MVEDAQQKAPIRSFDIRSSSKATSQEIEVRVKILADIIEEARNKGQQIDENYLLYKMRLEGYHNYTRNILYKDRLALDSENNYIRHFLPRYSRYQEDIANTLDWMHKECMELFDADWMVEKTIIRQTKDGEFRTVTIEDQEKKQKLMCLNTLGKVIELKQKHCEGQNIQISAVIVQKELALKKAEIYKQKEEIKHLQVLTTKQENAPKQK